MCCATCNSDYCCVHHCQDELVNLCGETIKKFYGKDPKASDSYGRIVSQRHYEFVLLNKFYLYYLCRSFKFDGTTAWLDFYLFNLSTY